MVHFPSHIWLILGCVGLAALIAFLHMVATLVRNEVLLHDLQVDVATLRKRYFEQMREAEGGAPAQSEPDEDVRENSSEGAAPIPMPSPTEPSAQAA